MRSPAVLIATTWQKHQQLGLYPAAGSTVCVSQGASMRALHEVHGQCLLVSSCLPLSFLKSLHTIKGVVWPQVCCCFMATGWQPVLLPSQPLPAWSKAEWMEGEDYSFPGGDCFLQTPAPSLVLAKKHLCVHPGLWQCEARWPRPVPSFGAAVVAAWAKSGFHGRTGDSLWQCQFWPSGAVLILSVGQL